MNTIKFEELAISQDILKTIQSLGYINPSKVQAQVIPVAMEGKDVIVKSQTGSGKTAAFAIPICEKIEIEERAPQVLVLTPTRELAVQVKEDITNIGRFKKVRCAAVFGKQPVEQQRKELKQRIHVIVGTPGRTLDHIQRGNIDLEKIKYLVLDEADEMLSMGFIDQMEEILKEVPKERITMLFSATLPESIERLCHRYMIDPVKIEINPEKLTVEKIEQSYYEIEEHKKFTLLKRILYMENPDCAIVFCKTKENVKTVISKMRAEEYSCIELHGGMLQKDRLETMERFKRGDLRFLVATDVAARGIDIDNVTHVINYDVPVEKESYIHRIGRTGRAGKTGIAITFVTPYEDRFWGEIQQYIDMKIEEVQVPSKEEADEYKDAFLAKNKTRPKRKPLKTALLNKEITKVYIGAGKRKKIRPGDIVGAVSNIEGVTAEDIGIIDIQDSVSYIDIMNGKGSLVIEALQNSKIKGKVVRVEKSGK